MATLRSHTQSTTKILTLLAVADICRDIWARKESEIGARPGLKTLTTSREIHTPEACKTSTSLEFTMDCTWRLGN